MTAIVWPLSISTGVATACASEAAGVAAEMASSELWPSAGACLLPK